jgi:hypothetical protein
MIGLSDILRIGDILVALIIGGVIGYWIKLRTGGVKE